VSEARAEAERRWPRGWDVEEGTYRDGAVSGFVLGAEWAAAVSENAIRAEAVREATRYLETIHKRGLRSRDDILADMDSVAFRMEQGMTARGNIRSTHPDRSGA
jgi:hypothetical protein